MNFEFFCCLLIHIYGGLECHRELKVSPLIIDVHCEVEDYRMIKMMLREFNKIIIWKWYEKSIKKSNSRQKMEQYLKRNASKICIPGISLTCSKMLPKRKIDILVSKYSGVNLSTRLVHQTWAHQVINTIRRLKFQDNFLLSVWNRRLMDPVSTPRWWQAITTNSQTKVTQSKD